MPRTLAERKRIHRKARRLLGKQSWDVQDHADYMRQCISDMVESGDAADVNDAELICELLWEEEQSLGEYD